MSDFNGSNKQLCNALDHIANRKSTAKTDAIVASEAAARIHELEAENAALREARGVRVNNDSQSNQGGVE